MTKNELNPSAEPNAEPITWDGTERRKEFDPGAAAARLRSKFQSVTMAALRADDDRTTAEAIYIANIDFFQDHIAKKCPDDKEFRELEPHEMEAIRADLEKDLGSNGRIIQIPEEVKAIFRAQLEHFFKSPWRRERLLKLKTNGTLTWDIFLEQYPDSNSNATRCILLFYSTDDADNQNGKEIFAKDDPAKWEKWADEVDNSPDFIKGLMVPKLKDGDNILDLGCGSGRLAKRLADLPVNYFGADASVKMVEHLKGENLPNVKDVRVVDFDQDTKLPYPDESFDHVTSNGAFIYLNDNDLERIIAEAGRVLKLGGRFTFSFEELMPNRAVEFEDGLRAGPQLDQGVIAYYHKQDQVNRLLVENGFGVTQICPNTYVHNSPTLIPVTNVFMQAKKIC